MGPVWTAGFKFRRCSPSITRHLSNADHVWTLAEIVGLPGQNLLSDNSLTWLCCVMAWHYPYCLSNEERFAAQCKRSHTLFLESKVILRRIKKLQDNERMPLETTNKQKRAQRI
jgi:hypothetical protein